MTTIVLVDEDRLLRESLQSALSGSGLQADIRTAGWPDSEALPGTADIDLVVVSSKLPDAAFADVCREWAEHAIVVGLSKGDHRAELILCLEAGGVGVVTAESTVPDLVGTIEEALRGEACVPRGMLGGLLRELIVRRRRDDEVTSRFQKLTPREAQVLQGLAAGQDVEVIARTLFISPQTVRSHSQRILGKLGVHSRAEAVTLALDHHLVEPTPVQG
jgi:DNA-binding NarL/FixJ family response regulator